MADKKVMPDEKKDRKKNLLVIASLLLKNLFRGK